MKKIIFILLAFISLSAGAEIITMDEKNPKSNRLFIDEKGFYRFKRAKDIYQKECEDISSEEVKRKCMEAEKAAWERGKTPEDIKKDGTLFTGKLQFITPRKKGGYFYVNQGKLGDKIHMFSNRYYFENGLLHDIKTEEPVSADIVIGGVEGLVPANQNAPRFVIQQNYEEGKPVGDPVVVSVK